jgi:alpha,alpha-trehalose phosphorylase
VLALHLRGDAFTAAEKARDFEYYERLTVRDSSLSACTQAVVAAEVGHSGLAFDYLQEAALMDLRDVQNNTRNGLHMAALAGSWIALVAGFGGMRDHGGRLHFAPRLPEALSRIAFFLAVRGTRLRVEITDDSAAYSVHNGASLELSHHGRPFTLAAGDRVVMDVPPVVARPRPRQPAGREPGQATVLRP